MDFQFKGSFVIIRSSVVLAMFATAAFASGSGPGGGGTGGGGGGGGTGGVTPANAMEVRTLSERVPAGGTVQVKSLLTQPRPITSGGSSFSTDSFSIDGISITSPMGDAAGAGVVHDGKLYVSVISPNSDFGMSLDYPFITVTMDIPATTPAGSTFPLGMADAVFQSPTGPLTFTDEKPGTLTIGGSLSVRGVFPGGGRWPAGTVISVRGNGFQPATKITAKMKISNVTYISPTEMRFSLQESVTMDTQPLQVANPDGSQILFYSYLRGAPVSTPTRVLLQNTEPVFQVLTHSLAVVGPLNANAAGQFTALAIQNPSQGPVVVTFQLQSTGATTTVLLPSGGRVMDDLSSLLGGASVGAGDVVTVTATSGVQILGLQGDENTYTITPFLPSF
jgi:hypothetical protein